MGVHMVRNLLKTNHAVVVYDISEDAMKAITEAGEQWVSVVSGVVSEPERVISDVV